MSSIARTLVLWGDRALLAIFLTAAAAAYLDPTFYWFGAMISVGLPLLAFLLLPLALFRWRCRNRLMALIHVLLVLVIASRHLSPERFFERPPSGHDLVLMTFNAPRAPETEEVTEKVVQLVRSVEPDMIGLQESVIWASKRYPERIRAHEKFRPLIESLDYSMLPPREGPPGTGWTSWRQPLLARFEIDQQEQLSFQEEHQGWPRLHVLRTEFTWQERKIAHFNVHLATRGPTKPWKEDVGWLAARALLTYVRETRRSYRIRTWEVERIRELIEKEHHPVILSGDFNSTPDSWVYRRLSHGLQDAFRVAGTGWGATYHARFPAFRIDFVLLGPEFEAVSAQVSPLCPTVSDHRPLAVRFRWRQSEVLGP